MELALILDSKSNDSYSRKFDPISHIQCIKYTPSSTFYFKHKSLTIVAVVKQNSRVLQGLIFDTSSSFERILYECNTTSSIVSLSQCSTSENSREPSQFVSLHEDGKICCWNAINGLLVHSLSLRGQTNLCHIHVIQMRFALIQSDVETLTHNFCIVDLWKNESQYCQSVTSVLSNRSVVPSRPCRSIKLLACDSGSRYDASEIIVMTLRASGVIECFETFVQKSGKMIWKTFGNWKVDWKFEYLVKFTNTIEEDPVPSSTNNIPFHMSLSEDGQTVLLLWHRAFVVIPSVCFKNRSDLDSQVVGQQCWFGNQQRKIISGKTIISDQAAAAVVVLYHDGGNVSLYHLKEGDKNTLSLELTWPDTLSSLISCREAAEIVTTAAQDLISSPAKSFAEILYQSRISSSGSEFIMTTDSEVVTRFYTNSKGILCTSVLDIMKTALRTSTIENPPNKAEGCCCSMLITGIADNSTTRPGIIVTGYESGRVVVTSVLESQNNHQLVLSEECNNNIRISCLSHLVVAQNDKSMLNEAEDSFTTFGENIVTSNKSSVSLLLSKVNDGIRSAMISLPSSTSAEPLDTTSPNSMTLSPDEQLHSMDVLVFAGSSDGTLSIYKLRGNSVSGSFTWNWSSTVVGKFKKHTESVTNVSVSPSGTLVGTIGLDNKVCIYTVGSNNEFCLRAELFGHTCAVKNIDWTFAFGHGLVNTNTSDDRTYVWNLKTGVLERIVPSALIYQTEFLRNDSSEEKSLVLYYDIYNTSRALSNLVSMRGGANTSYNNAVVLESSPLELALFTNLLCWGQNAQVDELCTSVLGISKSSAAATISTFGFVNEENVVTSATINQCDWTARYKHSASLTAIIQLYVVSICMELMGNNDSVTTTDTSNDEEYCRQMQQVLWSRVLTQYSVEIPEHPKVAPAFKDPDLLPIFSSVAFDHERYSSSTRLAAKLLLQGVISRLDVSVRSSCVVQYAAKLFSASASIMNSTSTSNTSSSSSTIKSPPPSPARSRKSQFERARRISISASSVLGPTLLVTSTLGMSFPGEVSPSVARLVVDLLVTMLYGPDAAFACELLAKGLFIWRPHLSDLVAVIQQLLSLTDEEDCMATRFLMELGASEPDTFIGIIRHEISLSRPDSSDFSHCAAAITSLMGLLQSHFITLFRYLPAIVETVLSSLDPSKPARRKACLAVSTRALYDLVQKFPMVGFHKETQRLGVGTAEALIIIYDLRTATKWRVLEGHSSPISALAFSLSGNKLVSYSAREASIRWWSSGSSGLFGGILSLQGKNSKALTLRTIGRSFELNEIIRYCRIVIKEDDSTILLTREDGSKSIFDL